MSGRLMKETQEHFAWSESAALELVAEARDEGHLHSHTIQKKVKKEDEYYVVKITKVYCTAKDILEGEL